MVSSSFMVHPLSNLNRRLNVVALGSTKFDPNLFETQVRWCFSTERKTNSAQHRECDARAKAIWDWIIVSFMSSEETMLIQRSYSLWSIYYAFRRHLPTMTTRGGRSDRGGALPCLCQSFSGFRIQRTLFGEWAHIYHDSAKGGL